MPGPFFSSTAETSGMSVQFEWDQSKAAANAQKHGITFDEAATVFADSLAAIFDDQPHSTEELREIIIGHSIFQRLLLVSFTERSPDVVRIVSARKATQRERRDYEESARR
jgi:uncharacterized DUF497 family protein